MTEENRITHLTSENSADVQSGRKKVEAITSLILIAFSIFLIAESLTMQLFSQYGPGPGMFPLGLGVLLGFLSIGLLIENMMPGKNDKASPFQNRKGLFSSFLVIIALVFYVLFIKTLGYLLTTFLLVMFLMAVIAKDKFRTSILTAIGVTLLLFLIFQVGLDVHLPKGFLGF